MGNWTTAAESVATDTKTALQTVYDSLNQGQQKKIVKDEKVKALFARVGQAVFFQPSPYCQLAHVCLLTPYTQRRSGRTAP